MVADKLCLMQLTTFITRMKIILRVASVAWLSGSPAAYTWYFVTFFELFSCGTLYLLLCISSILVHFKLLSSAMTRQANSTTTRLILLALLIEEGGLIRRHISRRLLFLFTHLCALCGRATMERRLWTALLHGLYCTHWAVLCARMVSYSPGRSLRSHRCQSMVEHVQPRDRNCFISSGYYPHWIQWKWITLYYCVIAHGCDKCTPTGYPVHQIEIIYGKCGTSFLSLLCVSAKFTFLYCSSNFGHCPAINWPINDDYQFLSFIVIKFLA